MPSVELQPRVSLFSGLSQVEERMTAADYFEIFAWEWRLADEEMLAGDFLDSL